MISARKRRCSPRSTRVIPIPHFDGYPAILIELGAVSKRALREAIADGWAACADGAGAEHRNESTRHMHRPISLRPVPPSGELDATARQYRASVSDTPPMHVW